ncbi:MAG TPA: LPS export ABC transporter periplasmic protein LptC [Burkholderiaceae bacterium]|nr:LPS export ABC transporter periplasmic protein LptC [Burkholderiaceae bacterium]
MKLLPFFRRGFDNLVSYLPLLLMVALALGSYWLVKLAPIQKAKAADKVMTHEADYILNKFAVKTFTAEGRLKSELLGGVAKHYPDTDTIEIEEVRINSFNERGRLTIITSANRALSNADSSEVQFSGEAKSVREATTDANGQWQPRLEIKGDFLHAYTQDERIKSHLPVTLQRGNSIISAGAFEFDNLSRVVNLQGRVNAVLPATPTPN